MYDLRTTASHEEALVKGWIAQGDVIVVVIAEPREQTRHALLGSDEQTDAKPGTVTRRDFENVAVQPLTRSVGPDHEAFDIAPHAQRRGEALQPMFAGECLPCWHMPLQVGSAGYRPASDFHLLDKRCDTSCGSHQPGYVSTTAELLDGNTSVREGAATRARTQPRQTSTYFVGRDGSDTMRLVAPHCEVTIERSISQRDVLRAEDPSESAVEKSVAKDIEAQVECRLEACADDGPGAWPLASGSHFDVDFHWDAVD